MKQLQFKTIATIFLAGISMVLTLVLGTTAWMKEGLDFGDALYSTSLAFVGDAIYLCPADKAEACSPGATNDMLRFVRFSGLFTTAAALFAVVLAFLKDRWQFVRARFLRRHHIVLIGGGQHALDRYEAMSHELRRPVTAMMGANTGDTLAPGKASTLLLPIDPDNSDLVNRYLGSRPKHVVLGDKNPAKNLERARRLEHSGNVAIRIEDGSISRDLDFLMPALARAEVFSLSEITARALVTRMAAIEMAIVRRQERIHVGLIGFGRMGMAIAEELILRCHAESLGKLAITVFDKDPRRAENRLKSVRCGLAEMGAIKFVELDGFQCSHSGGLDILCKEENRLPFTALVVATGDDARNTAIGMSLHQGQRERLCLKAPIFVHQDNLSSAAAPIENLTGGLNVFGGRLLDSAGHGIEVFRESLAKSLHETWLEKVPAGGRKNLAWEALSFSQRRASYRAALSAIELLQSCGLAPDQGMGIAGMRVPGKLVDALLNDSRLVDRLVRNEHSRWVAERTADGYRKPDNGVRDDEKKLHPLLVPFDALPDGERQKDHDIVVSILKRCAERFEKRPKGPAWRKILRIGLYGPLTYDPKGNGKLTDAFSDFVGDLPLPLSSYALEIVTPNAPGFDRIAATALAQHWRKKTKRSARIVTIQAASRKALDKLASGKVPAAEAQAQSAAMEASVDSAPRKMDLRPVGVSDAEIIGNHDQFVQIIGSVGAHINAISDLVIAAMGPDKASHAHAALEERKAMARPFAELWQ